MGTSNQNATPQPQPRPSSPLLVRGAEPGIEWQDYPQIKPGLYVAYCFWAKSYRDRAFHRWTCMLRFKVLSENLLDVIATVPMWLSLGGNETPRAPRRGKFWAEWVRANGGRPERVDRLSPQVFVHRMARVEIADTAGDAPYSVVRKIVEWQTGAIPGNSVSKSHSQGRHREGTGDE